MDDEGRPGFSVTLEALEQSVRVPASEQREAVQESQQQSSAWAWDEERRQARLAGGA